MLVAVRYISDDRKRMPRRVGAVVEWLQPTEHRQRPSWRPAAVDVLDPGMGVPRRRSGTASTEGRPRRSLVARVRTRGSRGRRGRCVPTRRRAPRPSDAPVGTPDLHAFSRSGPSFDQLDLQRSPTPTAVTTASSKVRKSARFGSTTLAMSSPENRLALHLTSDRTATSGRRND
jgi:hypothetical protein